MKNNTVEKIDKIQSLFDAGKSHSEIAKELGYTKIESFYRYIYRYDNSLNYKKLFNKKGLTVVHKAESQSENKADIEVETNPPMTKENVSKAESIASLISRGMDIREVSKKKHFNDIQDMADYMKSKGYSWSSSEKNYILVPQEKQVPISIKESHKKSILEEGQETMVADIKEIMNRNDNTSCDCLERYGNLLGLLDSNKEKLIELLTAQANLGEIPRFIIPGSVKTKSIKIISTLEHLMNDFCEVANITQKDMLEVAIIEFLKKYGYSDEVKSTLKI